MQALVTLKPIYPSWDDSVCHLFGGGPITATINDQGSLWTELPIVGRVFFHPDEIASFVWATDSFLRTFFNLHDEPESLADFLLNSMKLQAPTEEES